MGRSLLLLACSLQTTIQLRCRESPETYHLPQYVICQHPSDERYQTTPALGNTSIKNAVSTLPVEFLLKYEDSQRF